MATRPQILGIVAPHPPIMVAEVGRSRADETAASIAAMQLAATALERFSPDAIVLISPHVPVSAGAFALDTSVELSGSLGHFGAPKSRIVARTDVALAEEILHALDRAGLPAIDRVDRAEFSPGLLDHGTVVPLLFLDPKGTRPLVTLSLSTVSLADHRRAGCAIASGASTLGRRIAFVASGDLSHRLTPEAPAGYSPRAHEFDAAVVGLIERSDLDGLLNLDPILIAEAGECGLRSLVTLTGVMSTATASQVLAYESPWGVGYLTALVADADVLDSLGPLSPHSCTPPAGRKRGAAGHDGHPIVALARAAIEAHVRGEAPPTATLAPDPALPDLAATFVTLNRGGLLRGCIGTLMPACVSLAEEVAANAVKAATQDPRFPPLSAEELLYLDVKVDVLHSPVPAHISELDPMRYGVIVRCGQRTGVLLPDLDGVHTAEQQVAIARRKAGISPTETIEVERFRVDRYA